MDAFHYHNIFETKGLEYIAIIVFFSILIPFWLLLNRPLKLVTQLRKSLGFISPGSIKIPQGLFFTKNHTWAHLDSSGAAKVGLDDLLLHFTGEVKFNQLKKSGDIISKGDLLAKISQDNKSLKVYAPVSGKILATNNVLAKHPEIANSDPYQTGWIYKIKPTGWQAETNSYYLAEDATNWMLKELERMKDFVSVSMATFNPAGANIILQDGGELHDHILADMEPEVWAEFQYKFMDINKE